MEYLYSFSECCAILPAAAIALAPLVAMSALRHRTCLVVLAFLALLAALESFVCVQLGLTSNQLVIPTIALFAYPYWRASRLTVNRAAFVYLVSFAIAVYVNTIAVAVDAAVVGNTVSELYLAWPGALTQWALTAVLMAILFVPHARVIPQVLNSPVINTLAWRMFWLVPAFSCALLWLLTPTIVATELGDFAPAHVCIAATGIIVLDYVVYWLASILAERSSELMLIAQRNHFLTIQTLQFKRLNARIDETRRARHDLRQHDQTILSLLEEGAYADATSYLKGLAEKREAMNRPLVYCEHPAVNALLGYYLEQAHDLGAVLTVTARIPSNLDVDDDDLAILLGNLLENAVEALAEQEEGPRELRVHVTGDPGKPVFVAVDNSYSGPLVRNGDHYASTKAHGSGIGIESVSAIAASYDGVAKFECNDTLFQASVMLNPAGA